MSKRKKRIGWSPLGLDKYIKTIQFLITLHNSNKYALKLDKAIKTVFKLIKNNNEIGRKTEYNNYRFWIIDNYKLIYEITEESIIVHSLFDTRSNPDKLEKIIKK